MISVIGAKMACPKAAANGFLTFKANQITNVNARNLGRYVIDPKT